MDDWGHLPTTGDNPAPKPSVHDSLWILGTNRWGHATTLTSPDNVLSTIHRPYYYDYYELQLCI